MAVNALEVYWDPLLLNGGNIHTTTVKSRDMIIDFFDTWPGAQHRAPTTLNKLPVYFVYPRFRWATGTDSIGDCVQYAILRKIMIWNPPGQNLMINVRIEN